MLNHELSIQSKAVIRLQEAFGEIDDWTPHFLTSPLIVMKVRYSISPYSQTPQYDLGMKNSAFMEFEDILAIYKDLLVYCKALSAKTPCDLDSVQYQKN